MDKSTLKMRFPLKLSSVLETIMLDQNQMGGGLPGIGKSFSRKLVKLEQVKFKFLLQQAV